MSNENELLTVKEVAQVLRLDDTTIRRYVKNGLLEAIHLPARGKRQSYRIKRGALDKILNTTAA